MDPGILSINRTELEEFAAECEAFASDLAAERETMLADYTGNGDGEVADRVAYGVNVPIGVTEFPHAGYEAGELLAEKIALSAFAVVGLEDGARAMGAICRQALLEIGEADEIAAADLAEIASAHIPQTPQ